MTTSFIDLVIICRKSDRAVQFYSGVPNKRSATFINNCNIFQGLFFYREGYVYFHRLFANLNQSNWQIMPIVIDLNEIFNIFAGAMLIRGAMLIDFCIYQSRGYALSQIN